MSPRTFDLPSQRPMLLFCAECWETIRSESPMTVAALDISETYCSAGSGASRSARTSVSPDTGESGETYDAEEQAREEEAEAYAAQFRRE